uniref:ParB/Sulfiredoxin domain-containing protein n=1 Tax=viral metagenome TaxID=1070528 RepID=A0A6C0J6B2_9ZZZZ
MSNTKEKTIKSKLFNIGLEELTNFDNLSICKISNPKNFFKLVKIWDKNRILSTERCDELIDSIKKKELVSSSLHISQVIDSKGNIKYKLWDGQHRFYAFKKIYKENKDLINCTVNLYYNDNKFGIIQKFNNINKAVPISCIYTDENLDEMKQLKIKEITEHVIKKFVDNYQEHSKHTRRPQRPNFNRDVLQDELVVYIKERHLFDINKDLFWNKIMELNDKYKKGVHIDLTHVPENILNKCKLSGLFLFCKTRHFKNDLIIDDTFEI